MTPPAIRAKQFLTELQSIPDIQENVFSRDNTNSIEGYFSIIKRKLKKNTSTLVDGEVEFERVEFERVEFERVDFGRVEFERQYF